MTDNTTILTQITEEKRKFLENNNRLPTAMHASQSVMRSMCDELGLLSLPIGSVIFGMTVLDHNGPGFRLE